MKVYHAFFLVLFATNSIMAQNKTEKQDSLPVSKNSKLKKLENYKSDTLSFIKENFITHKDAYLHKPLGELLNDLNLTVKDYTIVSGPRPFPAESPYIVLKFEGSVAEYHKISQKVEPLRLNIKWETPLPWSEVEALEKKNNYRWTKEVQDYFSKQIIGDITMVNWRFKK